MRSIIRSAGPGKRLKSADINKINVSRETGRREVKHVSRETFLYIYSL